jgi:hypothetical protein
VVTITPVASMGRKLSECHDGSRRARIFRLCLMRGAAAAAAAWPALLAPSSGPLVHDNTHTSPCTHPPTHPTHSLNHPPTHRTQVHLKLKKESVLQNVALVSQAKGVSSLVLPTMAEGAAWGARCHAARETHAVLCTMHALAACGTLASRGDWLPGPLCSHSQPRALAPHAFLLCTLGAISIVASASHLQAHTRTHARVRSSCSYRKKKGDAKDDGRPPIDVKVPPPLHPPPALYHSSSSDTITFTNRVWPRLAMCVRFVGIFCCGRSCS